MTKSAQHKRALAIRKLRAVLEGTLIDLTAWRNGVATVAKIEQRAQIIENVLRGTR